MAVRLPASWPAGDADPRPLPEAKLAEARERHMEARKRVARGESPSKQKRIEKLAAVEVAAGTFKAVADKWYADKAPHRSRSWPRLHGGGWTRSCTP